MPGSCEQKGKVERVKEVKQTNTLSVFLSRPGTMEVEAREGRSELKEGEERASIRWLV